MSKSFIHVIFLGEMPSRYSYKSTTYSSWIYSSRLHVVMYSMLLIATPFVMLQNFLQEAIGKISSSTIGLFNMQIPIVPLIMLILLVLLIIFLRSYLTKLHILAGIIALIMIAFAQQITDYYFGHRFYDLQQNWHYIAYAIFAFMMYRDLTPRRISPTQIMLLTYFLAMLFSSFDEAFQMHMSNRTFDISDIAKDTWGALTGIVLLYIGGNRPATLLASIKKIRNPKLSGYFKQPFSILILLTVLTIFLLLFSSLLTDLSYWKFIVLFTIGGFVIFFLLFHLSLYKWGKYSILTIIVVGLLVQSYFFFKYRSDDIVHNQYGLTVYKGIPIFFFDVMIFPDGTFRLVDKKHYFNYRDRMFLMKQKTDIIIIGSGAYGKGGYGFPEKTTNQFVYNPYIQRGTQIIILKSPEACRLFNRLKQERKNVLFILHNTC
ncbi:MAG: hypothetical protein B6D58_03965 [candidate division Zixibacteria bacterium 4484_95]|nr:MAG: hypothetical protein B6D58_03965 [candidate division Zixibacteria bacterium 4484_95]